jgi:hypothetical protein
MADLPFIIEKRGTVWVIDWSAKGGSGCAPASAAEVQLWQALQGSAAQIAAEVAAAVAKERERAAKLTEALTYKKRWLSATSDGVPPCEFAAAIRTDAEGQQTRASLADAREGV